MTRKLIVGDQVIGGTPCPQRSVTDDDCILPVGHASHHTDGTARWLVVMAPDVDWAVRNSLHIHDLSSQESQDFRNAAGVIVARRIITRSLSAIDQTIDETVMTYELDRHTESLILTTRDHRMIALDTLRDRFTPMTARRLGNG